MNDDHAEETLLICRVLGGYPNATAARMTGVDQAGGDYVATVGGVETPLRIPWASPVTERPQIRREVVRMYQEACARGGVTPHGEQEPPG
ncbi:DUF2470 domain-containing protein [Halostreptopolyspora alba]|uniref:DUF2470 domain-containing protein n=1 Tax=Halostreptopolyspora alba TaxID=2487137 RepID=A0A3N0EG26_9ACTN|nr:DUF2470 domain-containing protein [Nocardiopsaceae bacterium YIM 96095]